MIEILNFKPSSKDYSEKTSKSKDIEDDDDEDDNNFLDPLLEDQYSQLEPEDFQPREIRATAGNRSTPMNVLIYNAVPKCGSTTVSSILEKFGHKLHFVYERLPNKEKNDKT